MERDEALKLLTSGQGGVAEWNERRETGKNIPDLSQAIRNGADLTRADLTLANLAGANLARANLDDAVLNGANLSSAKLVGARLTGAELRQADLSGADLTLAHLNTADLDHATLSEAYLGSAELGWAKLTGADFTLANLAKAILFRATLSEAKLKSARLNEADLTGADLSGADLTGADLAGATLYATNLSQAGVTQADFSGARCARTVFADVDLSVAEGLHSARHNGPSTIGTDTLFRSRGNVPEAFLRGCGVPEQLITYLPSLIGSMSPLQFYSCFISYSSIDREFADRLYADLQAKGVRCWLDHEHLKIGDKIRDSIDTAIRLHDKLMVVLTEQSIASTWVEGEVEAALERERTQKRTVLFPIRLDDAIMKTPVAWASLLRRTRHIGDFTRWKDHDVYQSAFARLLSDLKADAAGAIHAAT